MRIGLLFTIACILPAAAQDGTGDEELPIVTRTIAIRDARIVQSPGSAIERGTVVMSDGLITAVGADVEIPYDAEIIQGDSLTVYAGFIDGLSHVGMPEPVKDSESDDETINAADPPNDIAGIQPERLARDLLVASDSTIDELRKLGFTAAHVVPRGRMLPGTGSIVLLSNAEADEMVLKPDVSLFMQFEGAPDVYPETPMGIMAEMRQLVREADRRKRIELLYSENPAGMARPDFDPVHEAFYPVLSREMPVFVWTDGMNGSLEVHRALQLRDELGFSLVLAGLNQGFDVVDELDEAGVPLFLTLNLPEKPEADSTETDTTSVTTPDDSLVVYDADFRTWSYEDVERERKNLEARQALAREKYYGTAARLHGAGLRFGVSTNGAEAKDIRENIRKMIDAGWPEEAALSALTIDGARLLGVERYLGTVEPGKLANLVVTKGSYFDPESPVRYVFVDGWKFEFDPEEDEATVADEDADADEDEPGAE